FEPIEADILVEEGPWEFHPFLLGNFLVNAIISDAGLSWGLSMRLWLSFTSMALGARYCECLNTSQPSILQLLGLSDVLSVSILEINKTLPTGTISTQECQWILLNAVVFVY